MKDWLKYVKDYCEERLNAITPDEELLDYVCVEVGLLWKGHLQGLVGEICTELEVTLANNNTVCVYDRRNPAGSTITITSRDFSDGLCVLVIVQFWHSDLTYNPIAWAWKISAVDRVLGEPKVIDLREIKILKN